MTVHKGTMDVRNRVFSTNTLDWEPQSTGGAGGPGGGSTQVSIKEMLSSSGGSIIDSTAVALRVSGSFSASTEVVVRQSTMGDLLASVQQNSSVWQVQPGSTNWPKAAGLSVDSSNVQSVKLDGSTALTIGSIAAGAGRLNIGSTAADNAVVCSSVSSVAGRVAVAPNDTNFASSAGFHFVLDTLKANAADVSTSGTINSSGSFDIPTQGHQGVGASISSGTLANGTTILYEFSSDSGASWTAAVAIVGGIQTITGSTVSNPHGLLDVNFVVGEAWTHARVRVSAYGGSGSATVQVRATNLISPVAVGGLTVAGAGLPATLYANCIGGQDAAGTARMARMSTNYQLPGDTAVGVREALPDSTSAGGFSSASGDLTAISSSADALYVYAYEMHYYSSVLNTLRWLNGSTTLGWYVGLGGINGGGAGSTGSPAPQDFGSAVTPPGYLFRTSTGNPLILSRSSTGQFSYAVSAFRVR